MPQRLLICVERKINREGSAIQNLDSFFSHPETFMPNVQLVRPWRNFTDFKTSRFIRDGKIGMLEHMDRADHEWMGIASGIEQSGHGQGFQNGFRPDRLRDIDQRRAHSCVLSDMSIMQDGINIPNLKRTSDRSSIGAMEKPAGSVFEDQGGVIREGFPFGYSFKADNDLSDSPRSWIHDQRFVWDCNTAYGVVPVYR